MPTLAYKGSAVIWLTAAFKAVGSFLASIPLWVYAVIAVVLAFYFYGSYKEDTGYTNGKNEVTAEWGKADLARSLAEKQAILDAVATNDKLRITQELNHKKEIENYEIRLTKSKTKVVADRAAIVDAGGLRFSSAVCNKPAGTTQAKDAGQGDGAFAGAIKLPDAIETGLLNLVESDDTEINELRGKVLMCQEFATNNGFAPKPN